MSELCQFSIHQNRDLVKIASKWYIEKWIKITFKNIHWDDVIFRLWKWHRSRYIEITSIFGSSILHRKKHVETTWIFRKSKLRRNSFYFLLIDIMLNKVRRNDMFSPSKLPRRNTSKQLGNMSMFSFRCVDVISTPNRCWLHVLCWWDLLKFLYVFWVLMKRYNMEKLQHERVSPGKGAIWNKSIMQ